MIDLKRDNLSILFLGKMEPISIPVVTASTITDDQGHAIGALAVVADVTERKQSRMRTYGQVKNDFAPLARMQWTLLFW